MLQIQFQNRKIFLKFYLIFSLKDPSSVRAPKQIDHWIKKNVAWRSRGRIKREREWVSIHTKTISVPIFLLHEKRRPKKKTQLITPLFSKILHVISRMPSDTLFKFSSQAEKTATKMPLVTLDPNKPKLLTATNSVRSAPNYKKEYFITKKNSWKWN